VPSSAIWTTPIRSQHYSLLEGFWWYKRERNNSERALTMQAFPTMCAHGSLMGVFDVAVEVFIQFEVTN